MSSFTQSNVDWSTSIKKEGYPGVVTLKTKSKDSEVPMTCEIHQWGATVVSWKVGEEEQIFVSNQALYDGKKAIRGGIPVVFPQFGRPDESMAQHGFARTSTWNFDGVNISEHVNKPSSITAVFLLQHSAETLKVWPHQFHLEYLVTLSGNSMSTSLVMKNIGSEPFDCQALLHTYLQAEAIENVRIGGFENVPFIEKVGEKSNHGPREAEHIALKTIPYEVDRIYTPSIARNPNDEDKTVVVDMLEGSRKVVVSSCASKTVGGVVQSIVPDCVLWNLWVDKAMAMGDMQDDAYLKYVCIEPGLVEKPHTVAPGDVLTLTQTLTK